MNEKHQRTSNAKHFLLFTTGSFCCARVWKQTVSVTISRMLLYCNHIQVCKNTFSGPIFAEDIQNLTEHHFLHLLLVPNTQKQNKTDSNLVQDKCRGSPTLFPNWIFWMWSVWKLNIQNLRLNEKNSGMNNTKNLAFHC